MRHRLPLQSLALAVVLTWPAAISGTRAAIGSPDADGLKHVWTLWWMRAELLGGTSGLRTTLVNFPTGMELFPIEPLHAPLALLGLHPVLLSNLLAVAHVALVGVCAGWLGRLVSGTDAGGHVAGLLAQASSFVAFTLHVGVGELREVWWIPLGLGCLVRARESLAPRWFLALAACLAGATLSCFYHGFFLATAVSLHAIATLRPVVRLLAGYVFAATLAVAIVVPAIRSFAGTYGPDDAPPGSFGAWMAEPFSPETFAGGALDPPQLVTPRRAERETVDRQTGAYTGGRYLGLVLIALAVAGAVAEPRRAFPWLVVFAGAAMLSLGTVLWWKGALVEPRVTLPLSWINRALAWAAEPMNFPARFVVVSQLALAVLASLATRWRFTWIFAVLAAIDIAANDLVPWPRAMFSIPDVSGIRVAPGAIADFTPMVRSRATDGDGNAGASILAQVDAPGRARAIAVQLATGRPIQTVPLERADHWAADGLLWTSVLPLARAVGGDEVAEDELRGSLHVLRERGFGSILLTHSCRDAPQTLPGALLDRIAARASRAPCATLWPIPVVTATEEQARSWAEAQARRASELKTPSLGPLLWR